MSHDGGSDADRGSSARHDSGTVSVAVAATEADGAAAAADAKRYTAFISYRHLQPDIKQAKWLHESLERYEVPKRLQEIKRLPPRLGTCFRDVQDLSAAPDLRGTLEEALRNSRFLIVVCSPGTPKSEWVRREIRTFRELGRANQILAFLIDGRPETSFPEELCGTHPDGKRAEPLAADLHLQGGDRLADVKKRALLQLAAPLLGVTFDELWGREQERQAEQARRRTRRNAFISALAVLVLCVIVWALLARLQALNVADAARVKAEKAETERLRSVLDDYHSQAKSKLAEARGLRSASNQPDARQKILETIGEVSALRVHATEAMRELGQRGQIVAREEEHSWQEQADTLRREATQALIGIRLQRGLAIPLPEGPYQGAMPTLAVRADQQQIALVYPGATEVLVVGPAGSVLQHLRIPDDFAGKTHSTSTTEHGWTAEKHTWTEHTTMPSTMAFTDVNRLECQVGREVLVWMLPGSQPRREQRNAGPASNMLNANSDRFLATTDAYRYTVSVRDWSPAATPCVVWQSRKVADDRVSELAMGSDGRALFIRSEAGLTLVDAATGATASQDWPANQEAKVVLGKMSAFPLGVAMLELRTVNGRRQPPQLVFWHATLPQIEMRVLHHDEPPAGLEWATDGLLVSGAADQLVRGWRGRRPQWVAGIAYLGSNSNSPPRRRHFPSVDFSSQDITLAPSISTEQSSHQEDWRRFAWSPSRPQYADDQHYVPPDPYPSWEFLGQGSQPLVVARRELLSDGRSQERTEIYRPEDGRPLHAFPVEGNGRLWDGQKFSPDRRYALVVVDAQGGRGMLDVWSLADRKVLGRLDRPIDANARLTTGGLLPYVTFLSSGAQDWLLASYPHAVGAGADMEIWRLPGVHLVGTVPLPTHHLGAVAHRDRRRATLYGGSRLFPPVFRCVIDLETAGKVCDLEDVEIVGESINAVATEEVEIAPCRSLLGCDPQHVFAWDLTTGKRSELGEKPWSNMDIPGVLLAPSGDRALVYGNLHDTGMAHVELWALPNLKRLQEVTYPTTGKPYVADVQGTHCSLELTDFPDKNKGRILHWRWSDGQQLLSAPAGAALAGFVRDLRGRWNAILWWQRGLGFSLQPGSDKPLVSLQNSADGAFASGWFLSPDGKTIGVPGARGGFWNVATGREIARFTAADAPGGFDPTSRWALTVNAAQGEISIWDLETGKIARRCRPRDSSDLPFDPAHDPIKLDASGKRLAVLSRGVLRLWDLEHNRQVMALDKPGHFTPVSCVTQHAGAALVASGGSEGVIHIWNRRDGRMVRTLFGPAGALGGLAFSPDGRRLAALSEQGVTLMDLEGHVVWTCPVPEPKTSLSGIAFLPGGDRLLAATHDGRLLAVDAKTGRCAANELVDSSGIEALALSPDGTLVALGARGGRAYLWDVARGEVRPRAWDTYSPVTALAFVGGNGLLAVGGGQSIQLLETAEGRAVWSLEVPHGPVRWLGVNEGTGELAVADSSEDVMVLNLPQLMTQLERLNLGVPQFPRDKWPVPKEPPAPAAPAGHTWQEWREKSEEFSREKEAAAVNWARSKAIALKPDDWQLWNAAGESFLTYDANAKMPSERESGRHYSQLAAEDFSKALALKPDRWQLWRNRAQAYRRLRDWPKALDDYTQAIRLDPKQAELWEGRGLVQHQLRRYDEAVADFDHALQLDPARTDAAVHRAEALRWRGDLGPAMAALDAALQADPRAALALAVRSAVYRLLGRWPEALADANQALRFEPGLAFALTQRGEVYHHNKQYELALADFDDAVAQDADYPNARVARGVLYQLQNQLARAITDFSDAIALDAGNSLWYALRADALMQRQAVGPALADYDRAVQLAPRDPRLWHLRGLAKGKKGDLHGAIADYDEALRLRPAFGSAYNDRGVAEMALRQTDKALADFDKAAQLAPRAYLPFYNRGRIYDSRRQHDKAIAEYTQAVVLNGRDADCLRGRGLAYAETGQWEKAAADFTAVLRLSAGEPRDHNWRALALLGGGDQKGCRAACAEMQKTFGDTSDPYIAWLVAITAVLVPGAVEDARPYLPLAEKTAAANPKAFDCAYVLGAALYRSGRFEEAERKLAAAGALKPSGAVPFDLLLLAMAAAKAQHTAAATAALHQAVQWIDERSDAKPPAPGNLGPWQVRLEWQLLRREAESLVKPAAH